MKNFQVVGLVIVLLWFSQKAMGHNKVVVIPLGETVSVPLPDTTPFINSLGMQFMKIAAGSFVMGSPVSELGRLSSEVQHTVNITKSFNIQATEVTNIQWNTVIVESLLGDNPSTHSSGDHPVESVSWYDAVYFANRLSVSEGRIPCYNFSGLSGKPGEGNLIITTVVQNTGCTGYRLPTEAEWEYAARAGTTKAYANPIGFDDGEAEINSGFNSNLNAMGWYDYNREMENGGAIAAHIDGTKPVAKKQPNAWGLYDMHGNVSEWNWDWFDEYNGDVVDPVGPENGTFRVRRGGGWKDPARFARSALRGNRAPGFFGVDDLGFRLVLVN